MEHSNRRSPVQKESMIGCVLPTRATLFTEVLESIERERGVYGIALFPSHDLPVPDAFNILTEKALKSGCEYIWFIEEDTVPPKNCLSSMLRALDSNRNAGAAIVEYPLFGGHSTLVQNERTKENMWSGLGCTLIPSWIFREMKKPWFRSDLAFLINKEAWETVDPAKQYGLYDVRFFCEMRKLGYSIVQVPGVCRHLQLQKTGATQNNQATHVVSLKSEEIHPSYLSIDPKDYL